MLSKVLAYTFCFAPQTTGVCMLACLDITYNQQVALIFKSNLTSCLYLTNLVHGALL